MLSIVIPTKNEAHQLPRLLRSLERQSLQPDEVIVADAHSTDETRERARIWGAKVVDGGLPAVGRNRGADAARGDVVLFLDADVELTDADFLRTSLMEMERYALDIATCDVDPLTDKRLDQWMHGLYNRYVRACGRLLPHAPGFCLFVRKTVHERIGGFDEASTFCEDHEYTRRAAKHGRFGFLPTRIPVSTRRFERDGRMRIAVKFALAELHLITLGPIRHNAFNYTFGHKKSRE